MLTIVITYPATVIVQSVKAVTDAICLLHGKIKIKKDEYHRITVNNRMHYCFQVIAFLQPIKIRQNTPFSPLRKEGKSKSKI